MALTSGRKQEIAQELRVAATWVAGPRQEKLLALALELEGESPEGAQAKAQDELAAEREDALPEQPAKKAAAKKTAASN